MFGSSSSLLLMLCITSSCFSTAVSVDCDESVDGTLTLLSQSEDNVATDVSIVSLPSTIAHATGQSFEGDDFTVNFVSQLQHVRMVMTSEWTAGLLDGAVIVVFRNSTVVHLPLDAEYCVPHQLFQHGPNSSVFVMCSNMSRVMKMELTPEGFQLHTTPVQAQKGQKYLDVPAVPLYHSDPEFRTSAAFIHFGMTSYGDNKTWLTIVPQLETGVNSHLMIICDDTYDNGDRQSCGTEFASIVGFNDTHFLLECRETAEGDAVRFLVDAFFKDTCEGIGDALDVPSGGEIYVGPDTLAINLGGSVAVRTNDFTVSYHCVIPEGLVERVDFLSTASNSVILLLFTSESIFTCSNLGVDKLLSSSPLLDAPYPYFLLNNHLFLTQEVGSADLYQISFFDVQEGCQVQYPDAGPLYADKRPIFFVFYPEAVTPAPTLPPTQTSVDKVTSTVLTPSSSLTSADITVTLFFLMAGVLILLIVSMIAITVLCFTCCRSRKSWVVSEDSERTQPESLSSSGTIFELPTLGTQHPSGIMIPIPETECSSLPPVPETQASDGSPPIQAIDDILQQTRRAQLV